MRKVGGYDGRSMSNRAVEAYSDGLKPASKIPGVPAVLVRKFCKPSEWHHTSGRFNRTDFYDPARVRSVFGLETSESCGANPDAVKALVTWKAEKAAKAETVHENQTVEWRDWVGTRKNPRAIERKETRARVVVKGVTARVIFRDDNQAGDNRRFFVSSQ